MHDQRLITNSEHNSFSNSKKPYFIVQQKRLQINLNHALAKTQNESECHCAGDQPDPCGFNSEARNLTAGSNKQFQIKKYA